MNITGERLDIVQNQISVSVFRKANDAQQNKAEETVTIEKEANKKAIDKKKTTLKPVTPKKTVVKKKITTEKVIKQERELTIPPSTSIEKPAKASSITPTETTKQATETAIPIKTEPVQASAPVILFNKADYNRIIRNIITENREYPPIARRRGIQGTVLISFNILIDGSVTDFNIEKSSGFSQLDSAAHRILMKSAPFPQPSEKVDFTLPITFEIK